jgi:hypothetical protein
MHLYATPRDGVLERAEVSLCETGSEAVLTHFAVDERTQLLLTQTRSERAAHGLGERLRERCDVERRGHFRLASVAGWVAHSHGLARSASIDRCAAGLAGCRRTVRNIDTCVVAMHAAIRGDFCTRTSRWQRQLRDGGLGASAAQQLHTQASHKSGAHGSARRHGRQDGRVKHQHLLGHVVAQ